jgi:hypothetical protein
MFKSTVLLMLAVSLFGCKIFNPVESSPYSNVEVTLSKYQKVMLIDKDFNLKINLDISVDGATEKFVSLVISDGRIEILN